jgi:Icc-related predicted phosphoesterase
MVSVVMVLGNHDYYGRTIPETIKYWENVKIDRLYVLHNSQVIIGDVRFVGGTLWTSMDNFNIRSVNLLRNSMHDFKSIKSIKVDYDSQDPGGMGSPNNMICPSEIYNEHHQTVKYLKSALSKSYNIPTICVTHHLPLKRSVSENFTNNPINAGFFTDLPELVEEATIWIHGHTHDSTSYDHRGTMVLCNPKGHGGSNEKFDPKMIIDI